MSTLPVFWIVKSPSTAFTPGFFGVAISGQAVVGFEDVCKVEQVVRHEGRILISKVIVLCSGLLV